MYSNRKRITRWLLTTGVVVTLIALLVGQVAVQDVGAAEPELVCSASQLNPDNNMPEAVVDITPDYLALMRSDGQDTEIFVQNRSTGATTQITNNSFEDQAAQMDGQHIVWSFKNPANGTWDIALHNIITGVTQIISNSPTHEGMALIEGEHVVWARNGDTSSVAHYNIATGATETIDVRHIGKHSYAVYGISNGKVLYRHRGSSSKTSSLHVYDLQTNQKTLITEGIPQSDQKYSGYIHGDIVVWQNEAPGGERASAEIYAFDLGTETLTRITNNDVPDEAPMSYGNHIVYRRTTQDGSEIRLHNLQSGVAQVIASSASTEFGQPVVNATRAAWSDTNGIYTYDIASGISAKLTSYNGDQLIFLDGNRIFWHQVLGQDDVNIYMAECRFPNEIVQLLPNADFEMDADNDKLPDGWSAKGTTLDKSDKLKRNKLKADGSIKQFAYSGETAFMFRGNPDGKKSKLQYKVSDVEAVTHNATLEFSAYVNRFNVAPGTAIGKVKISFSDGSKETLLLTAPAAQGYASVSDSRVINLNGRQIEQIKVQFSTNLTSGKFLIDAASLLLIPDGALQTNLVPLP